MFPMTQIKWIWGMGWKDLLFEKLLWRQVPAGAREDRFGGCNSFCSDEVAVRAGVERESRKSRNWKTFLPQGRGRGHWVAPVGADFTTRSGSASSVPPIPLPEASRAPLEIQSHALLLEKGGALCQTRHSRARHTVTGSQGERGAWAFRWRVIGATMRALRRASCVERY
jgi:hypothetical protein